MRLARPRTCQNAFLLAFLAILSATASTSGVSGELPHLDYAVFAVELDGQISRPLVQLLAEGDPGRMAESFPTLEKAVESDAEVLVIHLPRQRDDYPEELLQGLKKRKVIGIGYGAAQLYGQLELEINGGACAHFGGSIAGIQTQSSLLLEQPQSEMAPYDGSSASDNVGMFITAGSEETFFVDVIARVKGRENYAPIVRQNNYVLIGLSNPPSDWSADYRRLFRDIATAMLEREKEEFKKPEFPLLGPGKQLFSLANGFSAQKPFSKTHYYKFTKPTLFTATLEHTGSTNMMLIFMGEKGRLHWTREDSKNGDPLTIVVQITAEDIKRNGDNHWTLKATNFDRDNTSTCVLSVQYEQ
jgi:hypothetical protein